MFNEHLYHGTGRERGDRMLSNQMMEVSVGEHHWLGDGSYFFDEQLYAYKWISDMYKNKFRQQPQNKNLIENYSILDAHIKVEKKRLLDLSKAEYKMMFDQVYTLMHKHQEYSNTFDKVAIADGIVINYMFNNLGFDEDFDVVSALFIQNSRNYSAVGTRLGYMPQKQFCIKNLNVIDVIEEVNYIDSIPSFQQQLSNLYYNGAEQSFNKVKRPKRRGTHIPKKGYVVIK
ncbi:hypothetical protein PBV87_15510 [Niameybacter massiliensis]|uniref:Uncharacterized protein n=1 Tax=Holtiella tumoricola TaxID=3018743 RepID=A0AA42DQ80_9FIRM|nr:hypothetical protein [Holtiella tumoricola]MDA3732883.1 hypothetical protein [Holtiella tumoricola]